MARAPEDVPWWRVVAADGGMPTWRRSPELGDLQAQRLAAEGVSFVEQKVEPAFMLDEVELLALAG